MDTLFGIALVGLWIVISVVALSRAFSSAKTPGNSRASPVAKSKTGANRLGLLTQGRSA
jgi:hypothetical protein